MKVKILLGLSLALNLALLANMGGDSQKSAENSSDKQATQNSHQDAKNQQSYYDQLIAMRLDDNQAKTLIIQELKAEQNAKTVSKAAYWQPSSNGEKADITDQLEQDIALRTALKNMFGDTAKSEPAFREVFHPLAQQAGFLSSHDQIALHEKQIETGAKIETLFSKKVALEYQLRHSHLADKLRQSGVEFSEKSFRQTYVILAATYNKPLSDRNDPATLIAQRNKIKQLIGNQDGIRVLAELDKRFAQLQKAGLKKELTPEQIMHVYEIISDSEAQMIEGYYLRKSNPGQGIQLIRAAARDRQAKLESYLGEEIAKDLMAAFSAVAPNQTTPAGVVLN